MSTIFVRPAKIEDSELFTSWYSKHECFDPNFHLMETYTLCAFRRDKILGFMIIETRPGLQILFCFVPNPDNRTLESGLASSELTKAAITIGYMRNDSDIYFCGSNAGTNRIASHIFEPVLNTLFKVDLPMYRLRLNKLNELNKN